jgi:uncharacterized membrane protein YhhN
VRRLLAGLAAAAAAVTVVADLFEWPGVLVSKPMALVFLIAATLGPSGAAGPRYRGLIAAGLVCSLVGDVLLLWPDALFLPGLVAFLAAHVCYLTAFRQDGGDRPAPAVLVPLLAVALGVLVLIWDGLGSLRAPVIIYVAVIVAMWWASLGRWRVRRNASGSLAALGATAFVLSDGLLAVNRFRSPLPMAALLVLLPYYSAQFLLSRSAWEPLEAP